MPIARVEKIYKNKEEVEEFDNFNKQVLNDTEAIQNIFENGPFLGDSASILEKLDALESVFGMLNELTPEQREAFEEAVKRRPFFK